MTTQNLTVRPARALDAERWNGFLDRAPQSNFYQLYEWERVNREALGHSTHFLLAEDGDDRVQGVIPLVRIRSRLFGDMLVSMPFVNYGGPAADDAEIESLLVREASRLAEELGTDYLEIRSARPVGRLPAQTNKVSMTVPLDPDPDVVWRAFKSKHRNNIKSVQRDDVEVRSGGRELLDPFYELMAVSWRDLGTPLYGKSYFETVMDAFENRIRIFVAYKDGVPVATAFNGHFHGTVEGLWAAMDPAYRKLQANYVLYWEMIRDACERGCLAFHLGRSTVDSPAARWKERWTAEPQQLYWCYHLVGRNELPELNPDNPKFAMAIRMWRRLPIGITTLLGPPLARMLP